MTRRWSDAAIVALIATALIAAGVAVVAVVKATTENSPVQLVLETPTATPSGPTAVPWLNASSDEPVTSSPYPSNATPVDTPTRQCGGEDLAGRSGASPYGEAHPTALYFSIKNTSGDPCRLDGTPQVSFIDADGNDIPIQLSKSDKCAMPCSGGVLAPSDLPLSIPTPYGQSPLGAASAVLAIAGQSRGTYGPTAPPCQYMATAIVVRVPESDAPVKIPLVGFKLNPCVGYTVLPFNVQRPPPPPPDRTPTFQVHIVAPAIVDSGSPAMQYTVVLTNESDKTVSFVPGRCPNYTQTLGVVPRQQIQPRALNCSYTGQIAPGRSIAFAMELTLLPLKITTTYDLAWSWVDTYTGSDSVKVALLAANPSNG